MSQAAWTVDDYRTPAGGRPVREFLLKLSEDARATVTAALEMLARRGNELRLPLSRAIGEGLFEIRVRHPEGPFRIMYCFRPGRRVVLLHALVKRTEQTPKGDLDLARARKREIEGREE
ncbi:MAG TPA: type II toxin-antitoxin system RelE/ParE family toxin [Methylomirabilota bacterium]|jgi:phage-related protein